MSAPPIAAVHLSAGRNSKGCGLPARTRAARIAPSSPCVLRGDGDPACEAGDSIGGNSCMPYSHQRGEDIVLDLS